MKELIKQREEEFDKNFKCINPNCDGKGNIPHQVGEYEWETEQCQYCFEVLFKQKKFHQETIALVIDEVIKEIEEIAEDPPLESNERRRGYHEMADNIINKLKNSK